MTDLRNMLSEQQIADKKPRWDDTTVFWGIFIGIVVGFLGIIPRLSRRGHVTRSRIIDRSRKLLNRVDVDTSVANSLSIGREVARRRRTGE